MCLLLADFLRKSVSLSARECIPMADELSLAASFLAIEQVRFGPRLKVEQEIEESSKKCLVPPLLLQPLIENAVKHGIAHLLEGGTVRIEAERRGDRLTVALENPCDPDRPGRNLKGLGLEIVRNRLNTLYSLDSRVNIRENDRRFRVELSSPAVTIAEASGQAGNRALSLEESPINRSFAR